jgi:hypothetical protein
VAAHYNLAIIHGRKGDTQKAPAEAALFADEKDDPMAGSRALEFLREHSELSWEHEPWHLHMLGEIGHSR